MNKWVGEGNLLLKRKEVRFNGNSIKATIVERVLLDTGKYTKERFFKYYDSAIVSNIVFDVPKAKDIKYFRRKNYDGYRLRHYVSTDGKENSYYWGEYKSKKNGYVVKTRTCLKTDSEVIDFLCLMTSKGLHLVMKVGYVRSALNSKDGKVRITFDKDTHYEDFYGASVENGTGIDKYSTKIKVKYAGKYPANEINLIKKWLK